MRIEKLAGRGARLLLVVLFPAMLAAQTNCDEGSAPLNRAQPQGIAPQEVMQRFAAKEAAFKQARENYTYTRDVTVQTLNASPVAAEFLAVSTIPSDNKRNRTQR